MERSGTYRVTIHEPFSPRLHGGKKRSAGAPHGWMTRAVHSKPRVCRKECDCLQDRRLQYPGKGLADQKRSLYSSRIGSLCRAKTCRLRAWMKAEAVWFRRATHGTQSHARARAYVLRWRVDKLDRRGCGQLDLAHFLRWDAIISLELIGLSVAAGVSILKTRFPRSPPCPSRLLRADAC